MIDEYVLASFPPFRVVLGGQLNAPKLLGAIKEKDWII